MQNKRDIKGRGDRVDTSDAENTQGVTSGSFAANKKPASRRTDSFGEYSCPWASEWTESIFRKLRRRG